MGFEREAKNKALNAETQSRTEEDDVEPGRAT